MVEKRRKANREGQDRRIIQRLSDPRVATELKEIRLWVRGLAVMGFSISAFQVVRAFFFGPEQLALTILLASVFLILAVILTQYSRAISFYLANESITNLVKSIERQLAFWRSLGILLFLALLIFALLSL